MGIALRRLARQIWAAAPQPRCASAAGGRDFFVRGLLERDEIWAVVTLEGGGHSCHPFLAEPLELRLLALLSCHVSYRVAVWWVS